MCSTNEHSEEQGPDDGHVVDRFLWGSRTTKTMLPIHQGYGDNEASDIVLGQPRGRKSGLLFAKPLCSVIADTHSDQ